MLAPEARRDRSLLKRIIQRRFRFEEITHRENERRGEFGQKKRAGGGFGIDTHCDLISARARRNATRRQRPPPSPATTAGKLSNRAASIDRSGSAARLPWPSRTGRT